MFETDSRSLMPKAAKELCAVDLYEPFPTGRRGVRYILVCLDVFTKFVKLYAVRAATTRAYLQDINKQYLADVTCPKCVLSDKGKQFTSPMWKKQLADLANEVKFSPTILADSIGFFPVEVMANKKRPDILKKFLKKDANQ